MLSYAFVQIVVMVLASVAGASAVYAMFEPWFSGNSDRRRKLQSVTSISPTRTMETRQTAARKQQVQDTLNELNAKQKVDAKPTLRARLEQAGLSMPPKTFHLISLVVGIAAFIFILSFDVNIIFAFFGALGAGFGLPRFMLAQLAKNRQKKFLAEFANSVDIIVRGVKSGLPLNDCLEIIATESPEPVRGEFLQVVEQQRVGVPLMECFERLGQRVPVAEVNFFAIVLSIQQQAGGNLAESLSNLSEVLRGRKRLHGKVKAYSSEAKSSAMIIGSLPFVVMLLVYLTTPEYISMLWTEKSGQMMLAASAIWMLFGVLIMKKMINFDF